MTEKLPLKMILVEPGILSQTLLFYLYSIDKMVNKQRIICDRIPGPRCSIFV